MIKPQKGKVPARKAAWTRYDFGSLKPYDESNECIVVKNASRSVRAAAHAWGKRHGVKLRTRTEGSTVYVWREE